VTQQLGNPSHDEETQAEPVALFRIEPLKGLEDDGEGVGVNAGAAVAYMDMQLAAVFLAGDRYEAAARGVVYRVPYKVSHHTGQEHGVAQDRGSGLANSEHDALPPRRPIEFLRQSIEKRRHGCWNPQDLA
jgi:hypothetical protein